MSLIAQLTRRAFDGVSSLLGLEQIAQACLNESVILLPSASRTATTDTDAQHNLRHRGVIVTVGVTTAGTGSITATIQREDPVAGWVDVLSSAAITTVSNTALTVYPGLTAVNNSVASAVLARRWRVRITHNNSNAITYAVGVSTLS